MQKIIIRQIDKDYDLQKQMLIKITLKKHYNIEFKNISYTINGKPYIENEEVYFSISNDNNLLLLVFDNKPIGADIQFYRKINDNIKKILNINSEYPNDIIDTFSKKEAVIKLLGKTIRDINNIDLQDYNIETYKNSNYVINIASFKKRSKMKEGK